jgi:dihydrofolate reductase
MARMMVTEFISLDGVMEDPGGAEEFRYGGWSFEFDRGEAGDRFKLDETMETDALLLGRVTYDGFAEAWPSRDGEFADRFNSMPKYVVSSTLERPEWANSTVLAGDVVEAVSRLKEEMDGTIAVHGSRQLAQTLLEHDLGGRAPPDGLPGRPRERKAPLRGDDRQEAPPARRVEHRRRRRPHPHLPPAAVAPRRDGVPAAGGGHPRWAYPPSVAFWAATKRNRLCAGDYAPHHPAPRGDRINRGQRGETS